MNSMRYNLVFYEEEQLKKFISNLALTKGKNSSDFRYAYILHDRDIIEDTGELKKAHYHLYLQFHQPIKSKIIESILTIQFGNCSALSYQATNSNFLAYLTHSTINSKNKVLYDVNDIVHNYDKEEFNELYYEAVAKVNKPTKEEKIASIYTQLNEILEDNISITSMTSLMIHLTISENWELLGYIQSHAYAMNMFLDGIFKHNKALNKKTITREQQRLLEEIEDYEWRKIFNN